MMASSRRESETFFFFGSGSGCPATNFCKVSDFSEPIEPCWESNRACQPDPGWGWSTNLLRVGKGLPGFGIERVPSQEEVIALDNQATPAAFWDYIGMFCISSSCSLFNFLLLWWFSFARCFVVSDECKRTPLSVHQIWDRNQRRRARPYCCIFDRRIMFPNMFRNKHGFRNLSIKTS